MKRVPRLIATTVIAASLAFQPISGWTLKPLSVSAAATLSEIQVVVDGERLAFQTAPFQQNGYTLVPMRTVFEALGAKVSWEPQTQTIFALKDGISISLSVGVKHAVVNGKTQQLDAPAQLLQGATMVPLRFVAEALGAEVAWDGAERTVRIRSAEQIWADEMDDIDWAGEWEPAVWHTSDIVARYDDSVVTILTDRSQGSGMVVGDRLVLTNHHVVARASSGTVELTDGRSIKINGIVAYDEAADLAVIETSSDLDALPVMIDEGFRSYKGDPVIAISSPKGFRNTVSEGVISNYHYEDGVAYIQTTAPIDRGSSGGALFNQSGMVIGVITSMIPDTTAQLNLAVSGEHIFALLEQAEGRTAAAAFLPSSLPDTLAGASEASIAQLMEEEFSVLWTEAGATVLTDWQVKRDAQGWLIIHARINPGFYTTYADKIRQDMRFWALSLGADLQRLLPEQTIQVLVRYEQEFAFEPRGFAPGEVISLGNQKWKVSHPVIDLQVKDRGYIRIPD
ncbi:stalk domain-containing protein [Paenibacillus sp. 1P07SE]|uniref:stalk domain-containing protein n=1 Tax=Paenibacillus sp. 1P07SE TaxID=3132209 RepID=UPI0039A61AD7